jgi:hypothetical protein
MTKDKGFIRVEIFDVLIKKVAVTDKVSVEFSDLKLDMSQTQDLVALRKSGAAVDLVVRQRELPLFEEDAKE